MDVEERLAALDGRLAAIEIIQKRTMDAIITIGLNGGAWEIEDVARTLRELAAAMEGVVALEAIRDTGIDVTVIRKFIEDVSYDARRSTDALTPQTPDNLDRKDRE